MDRKSFASVLDEAVGKLEGDVRVLKNQQQTLTVNIKDLEGKRDKLSQEIIDFTGKLADIKKNTKEEADKIVGLAQEKLNKANTKDAEASGKSAELSQKQKEVNDLIKSNQGKEKNLAIAKDESDKLKTKLNNLVDLIQKTLE